MQHLVRFTTAEGREGQHTADSLAEALKFVERLRNGEDVSDVRVFRMQEIPINFRTYYKVEVSAEADELVEPGRDPRPGLQDPAPAGAPTGPVGVAAAAASAQAPVAPVGFAAGAQVSSAAEGTGGEGGGRRLFTR